MDIGAMLVKKKYSYLFRNFMTSLGRKVRIFHSQSVAVKTKWYCLCEMLRALPSLRYVLHAC